jgi:hypothetical protein
MEQGAFYLPAVNDPDESLDELVIAVDALWKKASSILALESAITESHRVVLCEMLSLAYEVDQHLRLWGSTRSAQCTPQVAGHQQHNHWYVGTKEGEDAVRWPSRIDTYFDLYVAAVWNIFRVTRMALICMIVEFSNILVELDGGENVHNKRTDTKLWLREFQTLADDLLAAIPYHLTCSVDNFLYKNAQDAQAGMAASISEPAKAAGGLLLMHPLFIASQLPLIRDDMRAYMRICLARIGQRMGIGQATILSQASCRRGYLRPAASNDGNRQDGFEVSADYVESGLFIVWAGVFF